MNRDAVLKALGIESENSGDFAGEWLTGNGQAIGSIDPTTEEVIATVRAGDLADYEAAIAVAEDTFKEWRMLPAPERGNYVRLIGDALRRYKEPLGALVSIETGKGRAEGEARGRAEGVLRVLAARGLEVSDELSARILACTDLHTLDRWITRAAVEKSVSEIFADED